MKEILFPKIMLLNYLHLNGEFKKVNCSTIRVLNIRRKISLIIATGMMSLFFCGYASAQEKNQLVRLAKLRIDSAQIEGYKVALKEEIETSVRVEPGVLTLYAVYDKDNPSHITIFERYANVDAYNAHLQTSHFKKYKNITKNMVKSLELVEVVPILLGTKTK